MIDALTLTCTLLCGTLVLIVISYALKKQQQEKYLDLPGPTGIPIFGCFFQLDKLYLHLTLHEWAKKYGDMFRFPLFGKYMWVINSSDIARDLYLREPTASLAAGKASSFANDYVMSDSGFLLSTFSPGWNYRRKTAHKILRVYGEGLRDIESRILLTLRGINQKIKKVERKVVDPAEFIDHFVLETLEVLLTGEGGNKELQENMHKLDDKWNSILNPIQGKILTTFPVIRFLPCRIARNLEQCLLLRQRVMDIIHDISMKHPDSNGMYQKLLKIVKEDETKQGEKITMTHVTPILHDLITAAYLTTRGTLMSLFKILRSRPDVQKLIVEEVDRVIGPNRQPLLSDREHCPYIDATILETLRYVTHTPFAPHLTTAEFEFKGILVPKDCPIFVNAWHIHHSEKEWEDPYEFKPERFLDKDGFLVPATHPTRKRLMSFGYGKRSCIGEVLAKSRIFLFVAAIMQLYSLESPTREAVPLFHPKDMKPGAVLQPTDFSCKFTPR